MRDDHFPAHHHHPEMLGRLTGYDFGGEVCYEHHDGTKLFFTHAFARFEETDGTKYLVVYTEHNGYHVLYAPDKVGTLEEHAADFDVDCVVSGLIWEPERTPDERGRKYWK